MIFVVVPVNGPVEASTKGMSKSPCMNKDLIVIFRPMRCCSPVPCETVQIIFDVSKSHVVPVTAFVTTLSKNLSSPPCLNLP